MEESLPDASFEAQWITCSQNQGTKSQDLQAGDSQAAVYSHVAAFRSQRHHFPRLSTSQAGKHCWEPVKGAGGMQRRSHWVPRKQAFSHCVPCGGWQSWTLWWQREETAHAQTGTHFNQRWFCKASGILSDEETEDQKYTIQGSKWRGWTWSSPVPTPHLSPHCQSKRGGPDTV